MIDPETTTRSSLYPLSLACCLVEAKIRFLTVLSLSLPLFFARIVVTIELKKHIEN